MKKIVIICVLIVLVMAGCRYDEKIVENSNEPGVMTQELAYDLMRTGADVVLIDVRTTAEFERAHIPESISFPLSRIEQDAMETFSLDTTLLVICQSGNRSAEAVQLLTDLGFTNVYDIGGIMTWPGDIN